MMRFQLVIAIIVWGTALYAQPEEGVALNNQAVSLMESGNYAEALVYLDKLTATDENNYIYRYNKAVSLFNLKRYSEAIKEYKYLHELDRKSVV